MTLHFMEQMNPYWWVCQCLFLDRNKVATLTRQELRQRGWSQSMCKRLLHPRAPHGFSQEG